MTSYKLRQEFLSFFGKKGHQIVPSSSLIPADPSVLFASAGMQQFIPYLSGEKNVLEDFGTRHLASVQKCFRTLDIEEVGDDTHHTFFEMMGNWSIGEDPQNGYFKEGAIKYALEFFVNKLKLDKNKFWITIFSGGKDVPKDQESINIWKKNDIPQERMREFGIEDNFWGPVGETGPCGPCSEIHYDRGEKYGCGDPNCGPNCKKCDRFVELWNLVFMEYSKNQDGSYSRLPQRNVDTGIGFERLASVLQKKESAYESDLFLPIIKEVEAISGQSYASNKKYFRII
ncbi:MAG: alanine--tRNA ligase-related protein, partial [bacterium]|nr:alanine--tRNA ligase-related protein [bacterium]